MKFRILYSSVFLIWMLVSTGTNAALEIEITGGVEEALPIAIVPFDTTKLPSKLPVDIAEIVSNDLNRSGIFD